MCPYIHVCSPHVYNKHLFNVHSQVGFKAKNTFRMQSLSNHMQVSKAQKLFVYKVCPFTSRFHCFKAKTLFVYKVWIQQARLVQLSSNTWNLTRKITFCPLTAACVVLALQKRWYMRTPLIRVRGQRPPRNAFAHGREPKRTETGHFEVAGKSSRLQ